MTAEKYPRWIVYLRAISQRAAVFAHQVPGRPDLSGRIKVAARAYLRSKESQQHCPPRMHRTRGYAVEKEINNSPQEPREAVPQTERSAMVRIFSAIGSDVVHRAFAVVSSMRHKRPTALSPDALTKIVSKNPDSLYRPSRDDYAFKSAEEPHWRHTNDKPRACRY